MRNMFFVTTFLLGPSPLIYLSFSFFVFKTEITSACSDAVMLIHLVFANTRKTLF